MRIIVGSDDGGEDPEALVAALRERGREVAVGDAEIARGTRAWDDANVLCMSLRTTNAGAGARDHRSVALAGAGRVGGGPDRAPGRQRAAGDVTASDGKLL